MRHLRQKKYNDGKGSCVLGSFSKSTIDTYDTAFIKRKKRNGDEEETDTYGKKKDCQYLFSYWY